MRAPATRSLVMVLALSIAATVARADEPAPYPADRVVYDLSSADAGTVTRLLDRASVLQKIYGNDPFAASVVFVVHEGAIRFFARTRGNDLGALRNRASDLSMGGVIEFRICALSAAMQGLQPEDFPGFVKLVPMADAELVQLQRQGYAYLR